MVNSLELLSFEKTADLLAQLYECEFNGKPNGRFRITRPVLAKLSGREYIERYSVREISRWLAEKHGLMMIDMHDEFPIIKCSILRRYRKATSRVLEEVLDISSELDSSDDEE